MLEASKQHANQPNQQWTQWLILGEAVEIQEDHDTSWQFMQDNRSVERHHSNIPNTWVLLDSQSNVDIFVNCQLLRNICCANNHIYIHTTAGVAHTNLIGDICSYGTVCYHPNGIGNILSLSRVKDQHLVTYDSRTGNAFVVHNPNGNT